MNNRTAVIQEILNRLGLSVAYNTTSTFNKQMNEECVVECATITEIATKETVMELSSLMPGPHTIEMIVSNFLKAFAKGYDRGYDDGRADLRIEQCT